MTHPTLAAATLALALTTSAPVPPPASTTDPAGIVMGVKHPTGGGLVLMIGLLNQGRAYERAATAVQVGACTRRPSMAYPACLVQTHTASPALSLPLSGRTA
ncbi:hypothetical protein ABZ815_51075 [Nonomuraea sp. NPDC047529]|uniref:hypothetical protein n=1 Tax=Nonomuraea sp. NPDC047529 TaxID=3155623 RepID=UPI0033F0D7BD